MKETKDYHDKDSTGIIIAVIAVVALIIGLVVYFMTNGQNDVENAIDGAEDTIEKTNDNDTKTNTNVTGSYQAKIGNNSAVDEDTTEDNYIELVLSDNAKARLVITTVSENVIEGTYAVDENRIKITEDRNENMAENTNENSTENNNANSTENTKTYEFRINNDDTLTYIKGMDNITLTKVKTNELKYIK